MRTLLPLLRIVALVAFGVAFVATWRGMSSTGMPNPEGMSADVLWWYTHQDDIRQVGLVVLLVGLVTMFVPAMLVTLGGAFMVAAYAYVVDASSRLGIDQPGAWWIFAAALVAIAVARRVLRPRVQVPPA
ncbi:hypothetical protein [Mumia sp. DW29H23]|uniref:hypothetical protein n=1 Tax=Mumia sp. DW29H23 TaxID=3421241 RepID=UPI003D697F8D